MLRWGANCVGKERQALFFGNAYIGGIDQINKRYATENFAHNPDKLWRGWFMCDEDGRQTGWYATADEARASVEAAFKLEGEQHEAA